MAWSTVKYATRPDNGFVDGSLDLKTIVDRTFKTYVLENRYLKVTLLPEFGGRILSMIYKPTGHEQLYRTEVGVPYGMRAGNFYYDWMMVYGGIFPTFPDAEHGKTWLKPWDFRVVKQTAEGPRALLTIDEALKFGANPGTIFLGLRDGAAVFGMGISAAAVEKLLPRNDVAVTELRGMAMQGVVPPDQLAAIAMAKSM